MVRQARMVELMYADDGRYCVYVDRSHSISPFAQQTDEIFTTHVSQLARKFGTVIEVIEVKPDQHDDQKRWFQVKFEQQSPVWRMMAACYDEGLFARTWTDFGTASSAGLEEDPRVWVQGSRERRVVTVGLTDWPLWAARVWADLQFPSRREGACGCKIGARPGQIMFLFDDFIAAGHFLTNCRKERRFCVFT